MRSELAPASGFFMLHAAQADIIMDIIDIMDYYGYYGYYVYYGF